MRLQDIDGYTPITKDNINKVKCARIISGEGSDKYNKYIQYLAKEVLKVSANRTDGYKHDEVGILARLDGKYESQPIYGYWDEKLGTSIINTTANTEYNFILDENMYNQTLVFVHNHPNNSIVSINDLTQLVNNPEILAIIAVGNNGSIKYAIKTSNNISYYIKLSGLLNNKKYKDKALQIYNKIINGLDDYNIEFGGN